MNSGRDGLRPEDPSGGRGVSLPGEHAGGSLSQGAYSQLHVELSRWYASEGCCLHRLWAVDTRQAPRVPLAMDPGTVSVAPDGGGPVLTVREPAGMLPLGSPAPWESDGVGQYSLIGI